ncbi:MAG: hypothetical protein K8M05_37230 [Deltaproteobacteria bacterium]|nr:hypothetical protein [Kofleriaceae bacterium]
MRTWLVLIVILAASPGARADAPGVECDPSGPFFGAGVSLGLALPGAEAALGWQALPYLGGFARAAWTLDLDRHRAWADLQLGARVSPLPSAAPWWSLEAHAGRTWVDVPVDCPNSQTCYGGKGRGYAYGVAVRAAVARGRHGSFDVWLGYDVTRWRLANGSRGGEQSPRFGLGFSIY